MGLALCPKLGDKGGKGDRGGGTEKPGVSFSAPKSRESGGKRWWKWGEESSAAELCLLTATHLFQLNPQFPRQALVLPGHGKERGRG